MGRPPIDQAKLRAAIESSSSTAEVIEKVGCGHWSVNQYMNAWGYPKFKPRPGGGQRRSLDHERILELGAQGLTNRQISEHVGGTPNSIGVIRRKNGQGRPGANQKMTEAEISRARELLEDGASYKEVGRTLGRHYNTIRFHLPGYGWTYKESGQFGMMMRYQAVHDMRITSVPASAVSGREDER